MFSRSSSTTRERQRKPGSTTPGRRSGTISDPFISHQHAGVAAIEAYKRAQAAEQDASTVQRSSSVRPQRRKSQASGRSEGSHLEEARLGRRRSTQRRDSCMTIPMAGAQLPQQPMPDPPRSPRIGETIITRKRSVIPPSPTVITEPVRQGLPHSIDRRRGRHLSSVDNGSPAPRLASVCTASQQHQTPRYTDKSYEEGLSIRYTQPHTYADRTSVIPSSPPVMPIRETQTDDDIVAMARDQYLQDFHQKKPRERKSLFFGSVQKLQKRSMSELDHDGRSTRQASAALTSDSADLKGASASFSRAAHSTSATLSTGGGLQQKLRGPSGALKERFSKLFRKPSRVPSGLPAQQVRAETLHHPVMATGSPTEDQYQGNTSDPFVMVSLERPTDERGPSTFVANSMGSSISVGPQSTDARSRVTSWTDSTAAGTMSTHGGVYSAGPADEHGRVRRVSSIPTLRKKSSFFGRAIQTRLRKSSRAEMTSSDESKDLFEALQDRMRQPQPEQVGDSTPTGAGADNELQTVHSRSSLPSQAKRSDASAVNTIRAIGLESDTIRPQMMSPVIEASPDRALQQSSSPSTTPTQRYSSATRAKRPSTMYAKAPSQEHIARRMQRAQNRWQGPLDAASPAAAERQFSGKYIEDNPYELPSLGRKSYYEPVHDTGGLPQCTKVTETKPVARNALISPSLYSRASDGMTPRPTSPEDHGGTVITVTSRQFKRYELSPPKQRTVSVDKPVSGSREWRKWLSDELQSFADPQDADDLRPSEQRETSPKGTDVFAAIEEHSGSMNRPTSKRHTSDSPPATGRHEASTKRRPRASRRSSFMNERFPIIESSRNSSRQSHSRQSARNSRKFSSTGSERPHNISSADYATQNDGDVFAAETVAARPLREHRSAAMLQRTSDSHQVLDTISYHPAGTSSGKLTSTQPVMKITGSVTVSGTPDPNGRISGKAKSAFDLRANYRANPVGDTRAAEVHRKTVTPQMFDDDTLRNISAGPYGSQTSATRTPWADTTNKENTPPREQESLPALSSSEWLAGPTSKKSMSTLAGQHSSTARYSSSAKLPYASGSGGSPGQRLVTGWLEERVSQSRENSPAFV